MGKTKEEGDKQGDEEEGIECQIIIVTKLPL